MKSLVIIGAGGHGRVVADTAESAGYEHITFLDDTFPEKTKNGAWPVDGKIPTILGGAPLFLALGHNHTRSRLWSELNLADSPVLCHPAAVVSRYAVLGAGTLVVAGSVVNFGAEIGRGAILNTGCSVDHDCRIGEFVHISPGARLAGNVTVGARSWVGIGAIIREGITIGADVTIGAGAVVIRNVPDGQTVVGAPAKILER
ncbi:MAG: acetyltransferase [Rhodobacteraceae bacterium]|nr:acetyltransferase [Paracoccaceae bacterium]